MSLLKKAFLLLLLLFTLPCRANALDTLVFERMWPNLQQPWYFQPFDIDVDEQGNIYVTNWGSSVMKLNRDGQVITVWKGGITEGAGWTNLRGIAIGPDTYAYVVDSGRSLIQKFDLDGRFITSWGGWGNGNGQFKFYDTLSDQADDDILTVEGAGIAVDQTGNVYVADTANNRIQKFDSNGTYITQWSQDSNTYGQLDRPIGIDVDMSGNVYVVDTFNNRVVKFNSDGTYITHWGGYGTGVSVEEPGAEGLFFLDNRDSGEDHVRGNGIYVDDQGFVYVSDYFNNRIQKFSADGTFVDQQGVYGPENGNFLSPKGIAGTRDGSLFVVESGNNRVQKFTADLVYVTKWGSTGTENGYFNDPSGVAVDSLGNVYVSDTQLQLIQKFSANGQYLGEWIHNDSTFGNFSWVPDNVVIDSSPHDGNDYVYVADAWDRIQKFDTSGNLKAQWGSQGAGDGQLDLGFGGGAGMAFDNDHYLYLADIHNNRISKWAPPETSPSEPHTFYTAWGEYGTDPGQFNFQDHEIAQIAIDKGSGVLYVADTGNGRVQRFNLDGTYIDSLNYSGWDALGAAPRAVAVDAAGNVFVASGANNNKEIQVFNSSGTFITDLFNHGSAPGQLNYPYALAFSPTNGKLYITDTFNQRVQVFKPITAATGSKAIVVAGGGPFPGNNLWTATQSNANFAYRALTFQGFTKDTISYLSADTDFDLDGNGEADDIDADATLANLQAAITWANGAHDVVLYLVDHGGSGSFRVSGTETLDAEELDSWLDALQTTITGTLTVIYDACESGTFVPLLAPPAGYELSRVTITSTSPGESAYFISQGSISFSNYFWTHTFNGVDVYNAYTLTTDSIGFATPYQHPLLDANGNGTGNEAGDAALTENTFIGSGTLISGAVPAIGNVSEAQTIDTTTTASLFADPVSDDDGIARVWAVIRPPDYGQGGSDNTVQELPSIDLLPAGGGRYEVSYTGFSQPGTYQVAIYARDRIGNTAVPKLTTVSVTNPRSRKAIIVAGSWQDDPLWTSIETNVSLAGNALSFQGYSDDDILLLSPLPISGLSVYGPPTLAGLSDAVTNWAATNTQDLVIYLIGNSGGQKFKLNQTERLAGSALDAWLDDLQANMTGTVTLVYDASQSGAFLPDLVPPAGRERILITSAAANESANFLSQGVISFSNFFWRQVLNGSSVRDAFIYARKAMAFLTDAQTPLLDDNGNGIGNEKAAGSVDGLLARYFTLGSGIMLAGDEPLIGAVSAAQTLNGATSAAIWAAEVTSTGTIAQVWAVITPPASHDTGPALPIPYTALAYDPGTGKYQGAYAGFTTYGTYTVAFYATDTDSNLSMPVTTQVSQTVGPDIYEEDDSAGSARVIFVDDISPQTHTFHHAGDTDWVRFYGLQNVSYEILATNVGTLVDVAVDLYDSEGTLIDSADDFEDGAGQTEWLTFIPPTTGIYAIKTSIGFFGSSGAGTEYEVRVYRTIAPDLGIIQGIIYSGLDLSAISGAIITAGLGSAISLADGTFQLSVEQGTAIDLTSILASFVNATISNLVVNAGETTQVELSVLPAGMGDLNDDQVTSLADLVLALQIVAGDTPTYTISAGSDINNDSKIGFEEVLYILQKMSGIRE